MASFCQTEITAVEGAFSGTLPLAVGQAVSAYLQRACEGLEGIDSQLADAAQTRHALNASRASSVDQASPHPSIPDANTTMPAIISEDTGVQ